MSYSNEALVSYSNEALERASNTPRPGSAYLGGFATAARRPLWKGFEGEECNWTELWLPWHRFPHTSVGINCSHTGVKGVARRIGVLSWFASAGETKGHFV